MRITPINLYTYKNTKISNKNSSNNISFKADNLSRTVEPNLNTYIPLMNNKMKVNANIKFFLGALQNIDTNTKRQHLPIQVADIGCCDGALCRTLSEFIRPDTQYYGLDLSKEMLDIAKQTDIKKGTDNTHYIVGNAFDLPFKDNKMDAIIASSMVHELYSYEDKEFDEEAYSKKSIYDFMQQAYDSLKPGGILIIKDPATPIESDAYEKVRICLANQDDGSLPPIEDEQELAAADITKLCTLDKLKRFCMDFYPAKGNIEWEGNDCIMPKWLITEFVRHRKWLATPENWAYEIKENYGTLTPREVDEYAKEIGFDVIKVENLCIPNKNNIYAIREGEFQLEDEDGNILSLESFPMFLEVVLKKPRNSKK